MPGISRIGIDTAGGLIVGNLAPTVFVNGVPIVVLGAQVESHGNGEHNNPKMAQGSPTVFANNIPVCRAGDLASCGDAASGSSNVFAN